MTFNLPSIRPHHFRRLRLIFAFVVASAQAAAFQISSSAPSHPGLPRQWVPGASVTLQVAPSAPTGTFQWLHDEVPIPGATAMSLTLSNLATPDTGNYRLRLTLNGTTTFSDNTLTINVLPLPAFPVDPTFTSALPVNSNVQAVGPFAADGSMIVSTATADGLYQARRLDPSGNIVASFSLPPTARAVLTGFADGSLIFPDYPYLRDANGHEVAFAVPAAFDRAQPLTAVVVQSDGKFYLAQGPTLVRFLADRSVDPTFTFNDATETGITGLHLDRNSRLYVDGRRTDPSPYNFPHTWATSYRVTDVGARDPSFATQIPEPLLSGTLEVTPLDDGRLLYTSAHENSYLVKTLRDDGTPGTGDFFISSPRPLVVNPATSQLYWVDDSFHLHRYILAANRVNADIGFYPGFTPFDAATLTLDPSGQLIAYGQFTVWDGHATSSVARIRANDTIGFVSPNTTINPLYSAVRAGDNIALTNVFVAATGPVTFKWIALDGQPLPPDTTSGMLELRNISAASLGRYQLRVTGPGGVSALSEVAYVNVGSQAPYLANLSGRALSGTGEDTVIAGLSTKITDGPRALPTLLRGVGPALQPLGVVNFLPNPAIDVYNTAGQLIANNDQWAWTSEIAGAMGAVGAFTFANDSNDAALLHDFPTGNATMLLKSQNGASGVGLLEVYRVPDDRVSGELLNLSFRARTAPGDATTIAGFVIVDPQNFGRPAKILLRAVGPALSTQGIVHPLDNPILTLYNAKGDVVAQNDDWSVANPSADAAKLAAAMKQVGAFDLPANSRDSALLLDLPAGAYSMHATGGTGVVLLEIYLVR